MIQHCYDVVFNINKNKCLRRKYDVPCHTIAVATAEISADSSAKRNEHFCQYELGENQKRTDIDDGLAEQFIQHQ